MKQNKLYASAQLKLVAWIVAAMLLITSSFMLPAYFIFSGQLDRPAQQTMHDQLIVTLVSVQVSIMVIATILSLVFAKKVLSPIRKAHAAQAEFASNAHHQLRTPLAIMRAEIDTLLLNKNRKQGDYDKTLRSMRDEIELLSQTSEDLLQLADIAALGERLITHPTSQQLNAIVSQLQKRHPLKIKTDINPNIETTFSRQELTIILENLLDNAVKHGKSTRATVRLACDLNGVTLSFLDNGHGIKKGEESRIFERRYRGKYATSGSGLGLAIVADIVRAHAGTVSVDMPVTGGLQINIHMPKR